MFDKDNEPSLQHFKENVWLRRILAPKEGYMQMVNICIRIEDNTFASVGALYFHEGVYYLKNEPIGTIDDVSFLEYIEKLTGINKTKNSGKVNNRKSDIDVEELYEEYRNTNSIKKTAKKAGLSEEKTKRLLVTAGLYTSEKHSKIKALLEQGKSLDEIAEELQMSQKQLRIFLPYEKDIQGN